MDAPSATPQQTVSTNTNVPASPSSNAVATSDSTGSLSQNVLQTMQKMGFDTTSLSTDENNALQNFVQSLYQALTPSLPLPPTSGANAQVINTDGLVNATTFDTNTLILGGDGFKYTLDLSQANLGDYLPNVVDSLKKALENIGQYIHSDVVFNIKVIGQNASPDILAEADATMTEEVTSSQKMIDTSFVSDVTYQSELHPNAPDANLFINLARIGDMSFNGTPAPDKFDFTSIATHEILHGLAFTGTLGNTDTPLKTKYDELVMMQNNMPYFVGINAEKANAGKPVPLAPESAGNGSAFYHVNIQGDLMSDTIKKGQVSAISPLDLAILQDVGIPVPNDGGLPPNVKAQTAYDSSNNSLQKLIGEVKEANTLNTNFENLVNTFTDKSPLTPSVKLQDFLTQLALNTVSNNSLQNTVGSFISIAA